MRYKDSQRKVFTLEDLSLYFHIERHRMKRILETYGVNLRDKQSVLSFLGGMYQNAPQSGTLKRQSIEIGMN